MSKLYHKLFRKGIRKPNIQIYTTKKTSTKKQQQKNVVISHGHYATHRKKSKDRSMLWLACLIGASDQSLLKYKLQ